MCSFSDKVRNKFFSIISEMSKYSWLFVKNPGHDFTRKSPLSFDKIWNYLIRVKNNRGIVAQLSLPNKDEFDIDVNLQLTRRQTNEVKENPNKYRTLMSNMTFDYLPQKSKETISLHTQFRF